MRCLFFWMILLFFSMNFGQQTDPVQKTTVAVMEFRGQGVDDVEASILTSRFRSELVETKTFVVIERGQMQDILNEVGFQQSGCTSSECMIEMGRILNVQKMIGGSVGKFGNVYTLDLRIIDVATARIEETVSEDHEGKMKDLLQVIKNVAHRLAAREKARQEKTQPKPAVGTLEIKSRPEGAIIYVNDKERGKTPHKIDQLPLNEYSIRLEKEGYLPYETRIAVLPDQTTVVDPELVALLELRVESNPSGAELYIDGEKVGTTPHQAKYAEGFHTVKLTRKNYKDYERRFKLETDGRITVKLELTEEYLAWLRRQREQPEKEQEEGKKEIKSGGSKTWLWVGLGAAAVGGAAVIVLSGMDDGGDEKDNTLPEPPGRP